VPSEDYEQKDGILVQTFILERFPTLKRHALKKFLFAFDRIAPPPINALIWFITWTLISLLLTFYIYWIFAWGVSNGGTTLTQWALNFIIGFAQEVFFIQPMRILIFELLALEMMRPQLLSIHRTLADVAVGLAMTKQQFDSVPSPDLTHSDGKYTRLKVVQYTSGACSAARRAAAANLPGALVLHQLDDLHLQRCTEGRKYNINMMVFLLVAVPGILALATSDTASVRYIYTYMYASRMHCSDAYRDGDFMTS
jgi:hypothetical protein